MRIASPIALLLLFVAQVVAAPAPDPKPKAPQPGQFEIDFTPLEAIAPGMYDWRLTITVAGQKGKPQTLTVTGAAEPGKARHNVLWLTSSRLEGLELAADKSGKKLIVKGCNGGLPRSVEVSLQGFDQSYKPTVRRLGK